MGYSLTRHKIGNGIHFSSVSDPKFKDNRISVNFILPLKEETASNNAIVPLILRKGYRECPDFASLNMRLNELYGAGIVADVSKYNAYQILTVGIQGLDDRYAIDKEDVLARCAELLSLVILDPNVDENGVFDAETTGLEKQYLLDSIDALINDKRSYALTRCMQIMCEGEPVSVRRYGSRESAEKITPQSASQAYRNILETASVEIIFTGSGDSETAKNVFEKKFASINRNPITFDLITLRDKAEKPQYHTEKMDVNQGKLVMGMRCGSVTNPKDIDAARVFSALFGGTPFSKLFLNVREKLSLCYYCAARYDASNNLLLVDSGVEAENMEKARDEIMVQLAAVQNNDFEDEQLANTKLLIKNSLTSVTDSLSSIEGWYLTQILRSQNISPEEDAKNLDAVTREDIVKAAKKITLDTVYFLTGNGEQQGGEN